MKRPIKAVRVDDGLSHASTGDDQILGDIQISCRSQVLARAFHGQCIYSFEIDQNCVRPWQCVGLLYCRAQCTFISGIRLTGTITWICIHLIRSAVDGKDCVGSRGSYTKLCEQKSKNKKNGIKTNKLFRHALPPDKNGYRLPVVLVNNLYIGATCLAKSKRSKR